MSERVAVVGSRDFPDPAATVEYFLSTLPHDVVIISGDARGIDRAAAAWAEANLAHRPIVVRPDWNGYGKLAGKHRNWDIVRQADRVIAFWDGTSNGTAHSIAAAVRYQKPVTIHMPGDS